ncbi:YlbL family protein [Nocardioides marmorisolisilvae]|uniref:endopeptidase La n=1 Tax=Nocardioides marmorisolisilvae TaxID=1542737 RepID=A0A3N0DXB1_9ACTN|nr:S16 family serine protease [Nocardioides marmorisolisilvae]RNL80225.1 PDZ domain-containing protein [Nocardioides marmorisolisilvae]
MSRRTIAGLLAFGLVVALTIGAALVKVPYVRFQPGPTINVLGKFDNKPIIQITGHKTYTDTGGLRMVTIIPDGPTDNLSLIQVMLAWADPDVAVLPKDAVYKPTQTSKQVQQQSAVEMTSSQDNATAAALSALKIAYRVDVSVSGVDPKGPSAGILKKGDVLTSVDGLRTANASKLVAAIRAVTPGHKVELGIRRGTAEKVVTVVTVPAADDKKASRVGVSIAQKFVYPFKVNVRLSDNIGGPSAGMIFALSIYDLLTPGSLTGGQSIAGSGEISADGVVSPIGGIGQKLVGAQRDGARLFLVAQENCAEAVRSHYDKNKLRLVKVHTLSDAIKAVNAWRENPNAALPRCTG